jgi:penicillin-binding protein 2
MLIFDQLKKSDPQLRTLTCVVLAGMAVLLAGLWYVQIIAHRDFTENLRTQSFRTVRIPAVRGKILDRHRQPLAENQPSYNVVLYLEELRPLFRQEYARSRPVHTVTNALPFWQRWLGFSPVQREYVKLTRSQRQAFEWQCRFRVASNIAQRVGAILRQPVTMDFERFRRHYLEQLALPFPLLLGLDTASMARLLEQPSSFPGVDLEVQPVRCYPHRTTACHVLGYLMRDDSSAVDEDAFFNYRLPDYRGRVGIERAFDAELRGKAGVKSVLVNSLGYRQSEEIWTPAEPSKNVVLTLDLAIQQAAEEALQTLGQEPRGAVVVLDPNSGDLLALASSPAFDPNLFIPQISVKDYERLTNAVLRPQINRATQENYQPGSIFKIVTALAALDAGLDPEDTIYNPGHIFIARREIRDEAMPGVYNFKRGFIKSSNTYFISNGLRAGIESLVRIGQRLHLGERTGLPTGQEVSGNLPSPRRIRVGWTAGDTANLCIGQGAIDVTPLQMAVMTAAIANGGKVLYPRLVSRIEPADPQEGEPVVHFPSGRVRNELGVSARTLQLVRDAMLADVEEPEGTGKRAAVPGLRVCGKTGTAQITNPQNKIIGHTLWFTSYAPYESPRYVVLVMVESEGGGYGGTTCAPMAQKIYRVIKDLEEQRQTLAQVR